MLVCHSCDNPPCFNPEHLHVGDEASNAQESAARGRRVFSEGEKCNLAKLTTSEVLTIRARLRNGTKQAVLAAEYGVTQACISTIKVKKNWKWLTKGVTDAISSPARPAQSSD
jgi:hypothetical protein